jgi:HAD superfamily phosphoserine phosphatase-like hydrolase
LNKNMVISDVDGTLVKGSLVLGHAVSLHYAEVVDLGSLPSRWLADQKNEELIAALADAYRAELTGKHISEVKVEEYMDAVMEQKRFYSTLERCSAAARTGTRVHLISGSPDFLVNEFASRLGFTATGSDYHRDAAGYFTGGVTGMFGGEHKRAHLDTMDFTGITSIHGYGDTPSDAPILERADYAVLVDPHAQTLHALRHMVDEVVYH